MDSAETTNEQGMQLRVAFMHWAGCLGAFILLVVLASSFRSSLFGNLAFFFLSRRWLLSQPGSSSPHH